MNCSTIYNVKNKKLSSAIRRASLFLLSQLAISIDWKSSANKQSSRQTYNRLNQSVKVNLHMGKLTDQREHGRCNISRRDCTSANWDAAKCNQSFQAAHDSSDDVTHFQTLQTTLPGPPLHCQAKNNRLRDNVISSAAATGKIIFRSSASMLEQPPRDKFATFIQQLYARFSFSFDFLSPAFKLWAYFQTQNCEQIWLFWNSLHTLLSI